MQTLERMLKREGPNKRTLEGTRSLQRLSKRGNLKKKMKAARKRIKRITLVDTKKKSIMLD